MPVLYSFLTSLALLVTVGTNINSVRAEVSLPALPYPMKALEPYISKKTLQFHHGKHHAKYVATTSSLIAGTKYEKMTLEEILVAVHDKDPGLFNNAAQAWNHAFYWKCMKRKGGGQPSTPVLEIIKASFGSFEEFTQQFKTAGNTAFGSGWAWLVYSKKDGTLSVTKTIGAGNPMTTKGSVPILCMDVWEHAYYLDHQNQRPAYVDAFMEHLVNWDFVEENLQAAMGKDKSEL